MIRPLRLWLLPLLLVGAPRAAETERPPAVAGQFYPADPAAIRDKIDALLATETRRVLDGEVVGLLVPHAGVEFSGAAAAAGWSAVPKDKFDGVVIVGTAHYAPVGGAALYPGPYSTPIGRAEYDRKLAARLLRASPLIREAPEAHEREHSIEVQLPFVLRRFGPTKLVALVMNAENLDVARAVGAALAKAAGRRTLLVASSDLSHYPPGPVAEGVDQATLLALRTLDPSYFWTTNRFFMSRGLPELRCTYCGEAAVAAVLAASAERGATRVDVLKRYNSGDAISEHDYRHVVGYAAAAFVRERRPRARPWLPLEDADRARLLADARDAIRRHLANEAQPPAGLADRPALNLPAGVFVTLYAREGAGRGALRGCVGSVRPDASLADAVRRRAVDAAFGDSRFPPLTAAELDSVRLEVSVLSPPRKVRGPREVRPRIDGVAVEKEGRFGVFLPQVWEMLRDRKRFLDELCVQKAGLPAGCAADPAATLTTFTVESFEEP